LQYRFSDTLNAKAEIDWVFRFDHMTLAVIVVEKQYCKNSLSAAKDYRISAVYRRMQARGGSVARPARSSDYVYTTSKKPL